MPVRPHRIALVGVGKIAHDRHIPAIAANSNFVLAATASRNAQIDGIEAFASLEQLLARRQDITGVVLCTPPQVRYGDALAAINGSFSVMLEKPPGATIAEVTDLHRRALDKGVCLFATWHSRFAEGVEHARKWLADKTIKQVRIDWKEDVRRWHPGQVWIWQPGGFGVFDPGINALSILTAIFPRKIHVREATLAIPENRETPIAARLSFRDPGGASIEAEFDWRHVGEQTWQIHATTNEGSMLISRGGRRVTIDGQPVVDATDHEYDSIYKRFHELLETGQSDVDLDPMILVCDAFAIARRTVTAPFD